MEKQKQAKMHQNKHQNKTSLHSPVLLDQVLWYLKPTEGDSYLDLTAGYGGHAREVLKLSKNYSGSVLVDRDQNAIETLTKEFGTTGVRLEHQDFLTASQNLEHEGRKFDLILADLGVSSPHLNDGKRGFSIRESGPLDMRMDNRQELTAKTIVNSYSEADLAKLLTKYGEEPRAKQIAKAIILARPLSTTEELAGVAAKAWPAHSRIHPATRTFQALRIAVNDELNLLENSLPLWQELLAPGGRLVVISFHSLEDRLVKQSIRQASGDRYDAVLRLLNFRPVIATPEQIVFNPRARSAKLRAAVKINK